MSNVEKLEAKYSPPNVNYWGDRCCRAEAEIERLRVRNAALVESLRDHRCRVDSRATVGECQQCGCIDGILIADVTQQTQNGSAK